MFEPFVNICMLTAIWAVTQVRPIATAHDMVLLCRELIDKGVQAVQLFKGKELLGAICGQQCVNNTTLRVALEKYCKQHGIAIWLPDGQDIGIGDRCSTPPSLKPCRPQAVLRCKPPRQQPHIYACHQPYRQPQSHCIPRRLHCCSTA